MKSITIVLLGRVASKKNSKRVICRGNKPTVLSSKAYERFRKYAKKQIMQQFFDDPIDGDICVSYDFCVKGRYDIDIDNAIASVNDVLQESGVIIDDANITHIEKAMKKRNCEDWITKITIFYEN